MPLPTRLPYFPLVTLAVLALCQSLWAQHEHGDHGHHDQNKPPVVRPRVFLDKSPRIVWYQLNRLSNERLLLVERALDDAKYVPVFTAILTRDGMSRKDREEALHGLVVISKTSSTTQLLVALDRLDAEEREERYVAVQLTNMLLKQKPAGLQQVAAELRQATGSENPLVRSAGLAGLVASGDDAAAWEIAQTSDELRMDFLYAVGQVPNSKQRGKLRDAVVANLDSSFSNGIRRAAVRALATVPQQQSDNFALIAGLLEEADLKVAAVRTLLRIPQRFRQAEVAAEVVEELVQQAQKTPTAKRTTDEFIDAMQLVDQLLALLPEASSRSYRETLREIAVRVVRIHTVEEEMRYDIPFFAVEAGRPVQIVLKNEDLMPHNLVVTIPDALKEVALDAANFGPGSGASKLYVPDSDKVVVATNMVQARQQERLTFTAPTEPGEYPFVCTFPRHWMRMYGVMVVVKDLDAWQKNPVKPKDPVGSNRSFVRSWQIEDFEEGLVDGLRGRSPAIGKRLFTEATCAQCHKLKGQGGAVGPDLTDVLKRWKGNHQGVLREILDPSHKIDAKYAVRIVTTVKGQVISGIVVAEDKEQISIVTNPEAPTPTIISQDDVDEIVKSSKSMMPKALLDRFTRDEILEILGYITSPAE